MARVGVFARAQGDDAQILRCMDEFRRLYGANLVLIENDAVDISSSQLRSMLPQRRGTCLLYTSLRIQDKISELELQVEPLRRQSEAAKRYLILRDELRGLEISTWMDELDRLSVQTQQVDEECAIAVRDLETAKSELDRLYASGEAYFGRVKAKELEAEKVRALLSETESSAAELENEAAVARANDKSNAENIERVKAELEQQAGRDSGLLRQIEEREQRIAQIQAEKAAGAAESATLSQEMAKLDAQAGEAEAAIVAVTQEAGEVAVQLSGARATVTALADTLQELEDRNAGRLTGLTDAEERLQACLLYTSRCV